MLGQTHNKWATTALAVILWVPTLSAQTNFVKLHNADLLEAGVNSESLPDAPLPNNLREENASGQANYRLLAPKYADTIEPGYESVRLSPIGKVRLAGGELFSIEFPVEVVLAAGLSHGLNSDPKYGTNSEAFAKRVGAAGARDASQIILSDAIGGRRTCF
jgi:hypothetical protein